MTNATAPRAGHGMTTLTPRLTCENGRIDIESTDVETLRGESVMPSVCSIESCTRPVKAKGWCQPHYLKLRARPTCSMEGCEQPQNSRGWCMTHYYRWRRHGDPSAVVRREITNPKVTPCVDCGISCRGERCWGCLKVYWESRPPRACGYDGCPEPHDAGGWCSTHYQRVKRYGDPDGRVRLPSSEHLDSLPASDGECAEWSGARNPHGYGIAYVGGRAVGAHRYAWERRVGKVPPGLHIDHLCCNRACVNVDHLEPVTPSENSRRVWIRYWARGGHFL